MNNEIRQPAPEFAYGEIKRLIMLKKLKPGQRLSENALSKEIGVSRTPVREALRKLASEGWLNMVPDTGVWVSSPTKREILNAYEFRIKLETWGIEMAMPNVTPLLITKLEDCLEEEEAIYKGMEKAEKYSEINNKFHLLIAEASGNDALCQHLQIAINRTDIYMIFYDDYYDFENNCSLSEHRDILKSIKEADTGQVIRKIQAHIERGFLDLHLKY
jgi:DNA-binding GntR family transcriptional regulator